MDIHDAPVKLKELAPPNDVKLEPVKVIQKDEK